jgi:hypothetical protein
MACTALDQDSEMVSIAVDRKQRMNESSPAIQERAPKPPKFTALLQQFPGIPLQANPSRK